MKAKPHETGICDLVMVTAEQVTKAPGTGLKT